MSDRLQSFRESWHRQAFGVLRVEMDKLFEFHDRQAGPRRAEIQGRMWSKEAGQIEAALGAQIKSLQEIQDPRQAAVIMGRIREGSQYYRAYVEGRTK